MKATQRTSTDNIACVCYFCGLNLTHYELLRIEAGFAYAKDFGSDNLVLSEMFWQWFDNQYSICTSTFAMLLQKESDLPSQSTLQKVFIRHHHFNASDYFPNNIMHNQIMNEIFKAI